MEDQIRHSMESLRKIPVDTPVLANTITHLWSLIQIIYRAYIDKQNSQSDAGFEIDSSALNNILLLASKTISQIGNRAELVECVLKRQKAFDELLQIESQILEQYDSSYSLISDIRLMITTSHSVQVDLSITTDILLNLKYYAEKYNPEAFEDHVNSINSMLELTNTQRQYPQLTITTWNRNDLDMMALKEFSELFPERLSPPPIDEHTIAEKALSRSYGTSLRCLWDGQFVGVKRVNRRVFHNHEANLRDAILFLESLSKPPLASPYILGTIGISWDRDYSNIYLIQNLSPERSLYDSYSNPRILPQHRVSLKPSDKVSILIDVAKAVEHLHKYGIVHGRIKDANIMLYPDLRAKVAEVGVHTFLSNKSRLSMKGTHGIRWTAPEVMQQEVEWDMLEEENCRKSAITVPTLETVAAISGLATLSASVDVYAIGVLAVVLLTESLPFYNFPWDEGVKNALLEGNIPPLKSRYPDKDTLSCLENDIIRPCLAKPFLRPTASQIVPYLENLYCNLLRRESELEMQEHEKNKVKVQGELKDIQDQIKEQEILLAKGKELIRRKEVINCK